MFLNKTPQILHRIREVARNAIRALVPDERDPGEGRKDSYQPRDIRPDEPISSRTHNNDLEALFQDLKSLYFQTTSVETTAQSHNGVITEALSKSKASLLKTINDLRTFRFLKDHPTYDEVRFVDFNNNRNLSDRGPRAIVDPSTRSLTLKTKNKNQADLVSLAGEAARVEVNHIGGGRTGGLVQDFGPERMLDRDDSTFWADLILTDGPISHDWGISDGSTRSCEGLVSEAIVYLAETTRINNVRVLPFAEQPIVVIDIAYRESTDGSWIQIPEFSEPEASLDWTEVHFPPIRASALKFSILQENYVRGVYHLPERMVHATNLLEHAISDTYLTRVGVTSLSDPEIAQVAASPELMGYIEGLAEYDSALKDGSVVPNERVREYELTSRLLSRAAQVLSRPNPREAIDALEPIGDVPESKEEDLLEVRTIEYLTGIRTLEVGMNTYSPVSYYSGPKFDSRGTPIEISIETEESHPSLSDDVGLYRLTSIEYEIDLGEGLRYPIHPKVNEDTGAFTVSDEVVFIDRSTQNGYTRFLPSNTSALVRKNGVRIPTSDYTFSEDTGREVGKLSVDQNYGRTAVYTVTYTVGSDATSVFLPDLINSTPIRLPEQFDGTDDSSHLRLNFVPYIEYAVINDDTNFTKREDESVWNHTPSDTGSSVTYDGVIYSSTEQTLYEPITILVDNVKATNITDYESNEQPAFTPSNISSPVYEYFQKGRDIYFNRAVSGRIRIEYRWLAQHVQLLATLRCFKQAGVDLTPRLENYLLKMRISPL